MLCARRTLLTFLVLGVSLLRPFSSTPRLGMRRRVLVLCTGIFVGRLPAPVHRVWRMTNLALDRHPPQQQCLSLCCFSLGKPGTDHDHAGHFRGQLHRTNHTNKLNLKQAKKRKNGFYDWINDPMQPNDWTGRPSNQRAKNQNTKSLSRASSRGKEAIASILSSKRPTQT